MYIPKADDMYQSHWIVMWCPGKKIPIRAKPDIQAPVIGYVHSGYKLHVGVRTVVGFFELMDGKVYTYHLYFLIVNKLENILLNILLLLLFCRVMSIKLPRV